MGLCAGVLVWSRGAVWRRGDREGGKLWRFVANLQFANLQNIFNITVQVIALLSERSHNAPAAAAVLLIMTGDGGEPRAIDNVISAHT